MTETEEYEPGRKAPSPLKVLRTLHDLTITEYAKLADVDHVTIARIENGKCVPQRRTAAKLAAVVGCDPELLFPRPVNDETRPRVTGVSRRASAVQTLDTKSNPDTSAPTTSASGAIYTFACLSPAERGEGRCPVAAIGRPALVRLRRGYVYDARDAHFENGMLVADCRLLLVDGPFEGEPRVRYGPWQRRAWPSREIREVVWEKAA